MGEMARFKESIAVLKQNIAEVEGYTSTDK